MATYWLTHARTHHPVTGKHPVVGRSHHCFIVLTAPRVSREHAAFTMVDGKLFVEDLKSRNGTYVNGQRIIAPTQLHHADIVVIGGEKLAVVEGDPKDVCATLDTVVGDDEPSSLGHRSVLELAEELMLQGGEGRDRADTARAIHSMLEALVKEGERRPAILSRAEQARLAAMAHVAARWVGDESLDDWSRGIESRLHH